MKKPDEQAVVTIAEAIASAEAWNERAAVLSTMAYEVTSVFASLYEGGEPAYLIKRISGGTAPANPTLIQDIRAEFEAAAKRAREQARRILAAAAESLPVSSAEEEPYADVASISVPDRGYEIEANPRCPRSRQKLGEGVFFDDDDDETGRQNDQREEDVVRLRPVRIISDDPLKRGAK